MNYYPGTSSPGHYGTSHQYQDVHGPAYRHRTQGAVSTSYAPGQSVSRGIHSAVHFVQLSVCQTREIYSQPGVNAQWPPGHQLGTDFNRSASWPPHDVSHLAPQMPSVRPYVIESPAIY